MNMNYEDLLLK